MYGISAAEKGFSIEGGLLYDNPLGDSQKAYQDMEGGFGYVANIGYDFFERGGLEIGVAHSSHNYTLEIDDNAVREADASKTMVFLKVRAYLMQRGNSEIIAGLGGGLADISGTLIEQDSDLSNGFSGPGLIASFEYRYKISPGLALSAYLGLNLIDYSRYEVAGYKTDYPGDLPGGNSLCWGITVFHRIGVPQL
jgi:hypothetical protein